MPNRFTSLDCQRALWLLGLRAPVDSRQVQAAWRTRVVRAHPDRHAQSQRRRAAETLTRALNEAKDTLEWWLAQDKPWPHAGARAPAATRPPAPASAPAMICAHTGLRAGDVVRLWPYTTDDLQRVLGTEHDVNGSVWVLLDAEPPQRAERVRLAAFACPVCGACAGPASASVSIRPCPHCLVDLRRLERRDADVARIRRAIEARSEAAVIMARGLDDPALVNRAINRRRWARRLRDATDEDLAAALLAAFSRAFERWAQTPAPPRCG